jgi:uncharacterized membrane protein YkvA (DUF1232 family)
MSVKASRFAVLSAVFAALRGVRTPGAPSIGERARAVPRMIGATLTGRYRGVGLGRLAALAAGAVYVISPMDLLPEIFLPLIGLGDDLVVLTFVVSGLLVETEQFIAWEQARSGVQAPQDGTGSVVQGEVVDKRPTH